MTWFKVCDSFAAHRKVEALQAMPVATYTAAITIWTLMGSDCGLHLTDGVFSRVRARKVTLNFEAGALAELTDGEGKVPTVMRRRGEALAVLSPAAL